MWECHGCAGDSLQRGRVAADATYRIELRPDTSARPFLTVLVGEDAGQESPLSALYWSFFGQEKTVVMRRCRGIDGNGDVVERIIVDRDPMPGECNYFYRERWLILFTSNGNDLYFREDNFDWFSDPTEGGPPSSQYTRPILYRYSPLDPDLQQSVATLPVRPHTTSVQLSSANEQ